MDRRKFVVGTGAALVSGGAMAALAGGRERADLRLRIEPCTLELGRGVTIKTTAYNGQVPGPLLRLREGRPVRST